jgi:membrane protein DedA with SNARE-associated domain
VSSHTIHHLLHQFGLVTVFLAVFAQALCLPVPGSTVVIAAAVYAASSHGLPIAGVLIVATLGVTAGGLAGFAIGRWRGEWVLLKLARLTRQPPDRVHRLRQSLDRHAVLALLAARWFTGTRNLAGIASGASAMTLTRFGLLSFISALIWATVTSFEFYFFGGIFLGAPTWVKALLIAGSVAGSVAVIQVLRHRHRADPIRSDPAVAWPTMGDDD